MGLEGNLILFCFYPQLEVHPRGHFIKFLCFMKGHLAGHFKFSLQKMKAWPNLDCRMKTVPSELEDPVMAEPCANQPIWQRMHSLIPEGFSVTCQRSILGPPQWERQEADSNPQLKWLEQNNSAGITEHELVSSLWVYVLRLLKVVECKVEAVVALAEHFLSFMGFWHLLAVVWRPPRPSACKQQILKGLAGGTAVGCRDGKQKSPGLFLWVCLQTGL